MAVLTEIVVAANKEDLNNTKEENSFRHQFILNYLNQKTKSDKRSFTISKINKLSMIDPNEKVEQCFMQVLGTHINKKTVVTEEADKADQPKERQSTFLRQQVQVVKDMWSGKSYYERQLRH